jgi:L-fuculose-phosphate aldolase
MQEQYAREHICEIGRRLYQAGLVRGSDGNFSIRLALDEILITPAGVSKGYLEPADPVVIDRQGNILRGDELPSSEYRLHLAAYEVREDVEAVVHSHPPRAMAFSIAGREFPQHILPEIEIFFPKGIPTAAYQQPGTTKLAKTMRAYYRDYDLVIMSHHGVVSIGDDIFSAWRLTEHLEACAETLFYAKGLGATF